MKRWLIVTIAMSGFLLPAAAQQAAPADKSGLKVGEKAPAFKLKDQHGEEQSLESIRKDSDYVALVFYRSASW